MALSNTPPKRPPGTPNRRVTPSARFPTRSSNGRCSGRRSSWWREKNSASPLLALHCNPQHLETRLSQQRTRSHERACGKLPREQLHIGGVEPIPQRNIRRIDLHPYQVVHGHAGLAENGLEAVEQ